MIAFLRLSMGDNNLVVASTILNKSENTLFWLIWLFGFIMLNIIFRNFIIAEVGASYNKVISTLQVKLMQERGDMISES